MNAPSVTFTVDVENLGGPAGAERRYPTMTRRLMEFLEERGIRGSFFVEGGIARDCPELVREIAARGHEVGSHSYRHVDLVEETAADFARGIAAAKARLEQLAGKPVLGFRAPRFSLTPASRWVVDVLGEAGFAYSSSVLPGRGIPYGYPGAPKRPFLWPNGLLEVPCPIGRLGPFSVAFMGGMNLRYMPPWRYRWFMAALGGQTAWTYCHPYDIDTEEPFRRLDHAGLLLSIMLWRNRRITLRRWGRLAARPAPRLADRLDELRQGAPVFGGATDAASVVAYAPPGMAAAD